MYVLQFLKLDHSEPHGGRMNFEVFTVCIMHDLDMCARRFLRNCRMDFNVAWYNTYMEGAVNAHCSIFEIRSFRATWQQFGLCTFLLFSPENTYTNSVQSENRWQHCTNRSVICLGLLPHMFNRWQHLCIYK